MRTDVGAAVTVGQSTAEEPVARVQVRVTVALIQGRLGGDRAMDKKMVMTAEVWDVFGGEPAGCMNRSDPECEERGLQAPSQVQSEQHCKWYIH